MTLELFGFSGVTHATGVAARLFLLAVVHLHLAADERLVQIGGALK
ncbi:hypothetical protein [Pseudomonas phage E79]|uniref:Uncharacterized protein n=1 Tax=Pseudomonas phage E79 TaxID=2282401 RepID=A0A345AXM3_9CAUD|nr:hypothetical protein [Pseudomonas phage E79]